MLMINLEMGIKTVNPLVNTIYLSLSVLREILGISCKTQIKAILLNMLMHPYLDLFYPQVNVYGMLTNHFLVPSI